ncbi:MAG: Phosphoglycerate dehydrogenase [Clostridiales bacterium]|jgi:D-3-phosphoglycerate dehydrogenase|nr:Phosphoglycerate dehydrogenase [Clostridiales bacterium]
MSYKILLPDDVSEEGKKFLIEQGYEIKMGSGTTEEAIAKDVEDCDAMLVMLPKITSKILQAGKKLKVVAKHGVGFDNIDIETAAQQGIFVTNTPLANSLTVAELTVGFIISLARNIVRCDKEFKKGNFRIMHQLKGIDLEGKTLGLIGVGRIGSLVAKKAALGLGMKVIGYDPYITQDKVIPEIRLVNDWEYIFSNADFISVHLPVTNNTRGIIAKKEFEMMKPTSFLINAARGEIVNETDLIEALKQGEIAGAGLDVMAKEPPEENNPLLNMDNVILTGHTGAATKEALDRMALHAAISIHEALSGQKPKWAVNNPAIK